MEPGLLILFIFLALLAEVIGTVGGFGSSVFFVPIAALFLDFHSVLGITALFHLSSNLSKMALFRSGFDKRLLLVLGIPAVIAVSIGAWLSNHFHGELLEILLSAVLILMSVVLLFFGSSFVRPNNLNAALGGTLSGLTAGLLGTGGAIRGLTMAAFNLPKNTFIATSAIIDLAIDLSRSVVYVHNGYVHRHDLTLVIALIIVGIVGTYAGKKILNHVSQRQFRAIALVLILLTGIGTLIKVLL